MGAHFVDTDRSTPFIMPPSVDDWLPEDHLARFVVEIVDQLDVRNLTDQYGGKGGSKAYPPRMMLGLLFYAYATGTHSSRQIERKTYEDIAYRYIACNHHPDHASICNFRRRFLHEVEQLFVQVLLIAHQMSVLKIGVVSLDGTKIKANASKHRAMSYGYAQKLEKQLLEEVQTLTRMAESADRKDVPDGMSLDEELSHRKKRLEGIADAKAEIERRAKERYQQEKREYDEKVAKRKAHEERTGKKCRGKEPKAPSEEPQEKDQVNFTDEESRIMPQSGGGFVQAYNAQAAVDANSHMIIACHTTQKPNDKLEISPSVENLRKLPEILGQPTALLADAGYYSEENVKKCHEAHMTPHISFKREKHNQTLEKRMATAPAPPECEETKDTADQWMKYRLQTLEGKELYAKRKGISETVFGIVKQVMGFRQFMLRGIDKVSGEWNLVCTAWNIRRLHALTR